jgi:nitroimidazol reductase NimA-like FMN-containing flavoprotein (pyridoxamine 5'-phosphate oxidase superfamily)
MVGHTKVISDKFSTAYESIVLDGLARTNLPADERMRALELLLDKYSPADKAKGMQYAANSFERTEIIRLDITRWSGKCKRIM